MRRVIRGAPGRFYPRNGSPAFRLLQPQEGLASARTGARISQQQIRTIQPAAGRRAPLRGDLAADLRGLPALAG